MVYVFGSEIKIDKTFYIKGDNCCFILI